MIVMSCTTVWSRRVNERTRTKSCQKVSSTDQNTCLNSVLAELTTKLEGVF